MDLEEGSGASGINANTNRRLNEVGSKMGKEGFGLSL
jgi:hypothetical protein